VRSDLQYRRLFLIWVPLALTFLLVTGATPVVNAAINRLPGGPHEADLAAFGIFLSVLIVLHSPLFVAREITIKLSRHQGGAARALRFMLGTAAVVAVLEAVIGFTPIGNVILRRFATDPDVVRGAHEAFRWIWPVPFVIAIRGVSQAHQISADDTLFVGLGTLVRLGATAVLGFWLAPRIGLGGPQLGAICILVGIIIEAAITVWRSSGIEHQPVQFEDPGPPASAFAIPLMVANALGLFASLFYLRIAGLVPEEARIPGGQAAALAALGRRVCAAVADNRQGAPTGRRAADAAFLADGWRGAHRRPLGGGVHAVAVLVPDRRDGGASRRRRRRVRPAGADARGADAAADRGALQSARGAHFARER